MTSDAADRAVRASLEALNGVFRDRIDRIRTDSQAMIGARPHSPWEAAETRNQAAGAIDAVEWCRRVVQAAIAVMDDAGRAV